jgi:hypothetical protein
MQRFLSFHVHSSKKISVSSGPYYNIDYNHWTSSVEQQVLQHANSSTWTHEKGRKEIHKWYESVTMTILVKPKSWSPAGGRTTRRGIVESLNELSSFREILTEKRNLMRELSETRSGPGPKANEWLAIEELIWVGWILVGLLHAQSSDIYIYIYIAALNFKKLKSPTERSWQLHASWREVLFLQWL